jgi:predicted DCC family thiol-disulfide oxidoreductase YuxK
MKVYYNNSCKICKTEIDFYKKQKIDEIQWVDITDGSSVTKDTGKKSHTLLRRLHVEENGKIIGGAEAFLVLWKNMPKYRFLYRILKLPIIFSLFNVSYEIIAYFLYLKNTKHLKKIN